MTRSERILLLTLAAINFVHIVDFMILMPLGPQLMRVLNINPQQFSLLVAAYTLSAGVASFFTAFFADRFNRKHLLLTAFIGFLAGTFACAIAPTYHLLLIARIVAGMFGGIINAQLLAITGDVIPYERRAQGMGILMAAFSVASVAGVPLGLFLSNMYSWHAPFLFVGFSGVALLPVAWFVVPDVVAHMSEPGEKKKIEVLKNISSDTNQQRALLLMFVMMLGHFSIIPFIAPYMVCNVGFTEHQLTYIYFIGGGLTIFTSPYIGKLADRHGKFKIFAIFITLSMIPVLGITHLPATHVAIALVITSLFFVVSGGRSIPAMAMITSVVSPRQRGGFMNINTALQHLSTGLAAFLAGLIITKTADGKLHNYNFVGYLAVILNLCCVFIAKKLRPVDANTK